MRTVLTIFGTRPEIVKLAPVVRACGKAGISVHTLYTGQQPELAIPQLTDFGIGIDHRTEIMQHGQSLNALLANAVREIDPILERERPAAVIVQGDTTSALAGALGAQFRGIRVIHVEAGLRSGDPAQPFPEEMNRRLISTIASIHCAPTAGNVKNLLSEGISDTRVFETGNPVVDMVEHVIGNLKVCSETSRLSEKLAGKFVILATMHRRENFGVNLEGYLKAFDEFIRAHEDAVLLFVVHPNPNVRAVIDRVWRSHERILLLSPQPYPDFLHLMKFARLIASDSGGVQEEAASVGTPLLVLRSETERPEILELETAKLVPKPELLTTELETWHAAPDVGINNVPPNPFGDGKSGERIAGLVADLLSGKLP